MNLRSIGLPSAVAVLALSGCAKIDRDAGFDDVRRSVEERIGQRVEWSRGGPTDREVEKRIDRLLSRELAAEDAVAVALLSHRGLRATYEDLGVAQADLVQAGLLRNPALTVEVRFPGRPRLPLEVDVAQSLIDLLALPLRKKVAAAEFEAVKRRVAGEVLDHAFEVRGAYYELQGADQMLEMRRSVVDATAAAADAADRLYEAGNLARFDADSHRAQMEEARLELAEAEAEALGARERLSALMGLWGQRTAWKIAARLPDPPAGDPRPLGLESLAVAQRLDLVAARHEVEALSRSLGVTRQFSPFGDVEVTGHYEREPDGTSTAGPSVTVPLPIFDRGHASIARGEALLRQSEERYAAKAIDIRSEVRRARDRAAAARRRAEHYRRVVLPLRRSLTEEAQKRFNGMFIGVFELLEVKRAEIDAGREYVRALTDYWLAHTELERAVGGRLPDAPSAATRPDCRSVEQAFPATAPERSQDPAHDLSHHHHGAHP